MNSNIPKEMPTFLEKGGAKGDLGRGRGGGIRLKKVYAFQNFQTIKFIKDGLC